MTSPARVLWPARGPALLHGRLRAAAGRAAGMRRLLAWLPDLWRPVPAADSAPLTGTTLAAVLAAYGSGGQDEAALPRPRTSRQPAVPAAGRRRPPLPPPPDARQPPAMARPTVPANPAAKPANLATTGAPAARGSGAFGPGRTVAGHSPRAPAAVLTRLAGGAADAVTAQPQPRTRHVAPGNRRAPSPAFPQERSSDRTATDWPASPAARAAARLASAPVATAGNAPGGRPGAGQPMLAAWHSPIAAPPAGVAEVLGGASPPRSSAAAPGVPEQRRPHRPTGRGNGRGPGEPSRPVPPAPAPPGHGEAPAGAGMPVVADTVVAPSPAPAGPGAADHAELARVTAFAEYPAPPATAHDRPGLPAGPADAAAAAVPRPATDLADLARDMKRVLDAEARRHGIEV